MRESSISTHLSSVVPPFFENISTSTLRLLESTKCRDKAVQTLPLLSKISLNNTSFQVSINSLRLCLSSECLLNFLSNLCILSCVGKSLKFMAFLFLENELNLNIFTHAVPFPSKNSSLTFHHHTLGRHKLLITTATIFRKSVSSNSRKEWRKLLSALSEFNRKIYR